MAAHSTAVSNLVARCKAANTVAEVFAIGGLFGIRRRQFDALLARVEADPSAATPAALAELATLSELIAAWTHELSLKACLARAA
jgi:hypothetical protein